MKALKKLIPAAAMLVLCAAMMTTATFAWFNMNQRVAVDTGDTSVTAPTNIQIAQWTKTEAVYTLGDYGDKVTYTSDAKDPKINPATVEISGDALKWSMTEKAGNGGEAVGDLTELADITDDGMSGGDKYFKKFEMNVKNIGGSTIDVSVDTAKVVVTAKDDSSELYKSVCFMILVGTVREGTAAVPASPSVGATPAVVWDDGSAMHASATLIEGTADKSASFVKLTSQQTVDITVIAWVEGNKAACSNENVKSDNLAFGLTFDLKAESVS